MIGHFGRFLKSGPFWKPKTKQELTKVTGKFRKRLESFFFQNPSHIPNSLKILDFQMLQQNEGSTTTFCIFNRLKNAKRLYRLDFQFLLVIGISHKDSNRD